MSGNIRASVKKFKEGSEYNSQGHVTPAESKKWTLAYFTLGVIACLVISVMFTYNGGSADEKVIFSSVGEGSFFPIIYGEGINADRFYSISDSSNSESTYELSYDDTLYNRVQDLVISVNYEGATQTNTVPIVLLDYNDPIIEYSGELEMKYDSQFSLEDYLFVYDVVDSTNEKIELEYKDTANVQYYGIGGYTYYYGDSEYDNTNMMRKHEKGINYIVITAFDGHGNTSEHKFELTMY